MPDDVRELRATQPYEVAKIIHEIAWMNQEQTTALLKDRSSPLIRLAIANCFAKCIKEGDLARLGVLLDRWLGKIKEIIQFVPVTDGPSSEGSKPTMINSQEIAALVKRAQPKCKPTK